MNVTRIQRLSVLITTAIFCAMAVAVVRFKPLPYPLPQLLAVTLLRIAAALVFSRCSSRLRPHALGEDLETV